MVIIKTFLEGLRLFAGIFSKRPEAVTSGLFICFEKLSWLRDQSVKKRRKQRKRTRYKENEEEKASVKKTKRSKNKKYQPRGLWSPPWVVEANDISGGIRACRR